MRTSNAWAAIDAMVKQEPEPSGPAWFTPQEFAARYGLSLSRAGNKLTELYRVGAVERWRGIGAASRRTIVKYRAKGAR